MRAGIVVNVTPADCRRLEALRTAGRSRRILTAVKPRGKSSSRAAAVASMLLECYFSVKTLDITPVPRFTCQQLHISGVLLFKPTKYIDSRGFFMEIFRESDFRDMGVGCHFVQDNHSASDRKGTVRGLHYQRAPEPQAKLVRAIRGAIFDVAVDLRPDSSTYAQWTGANLTSEGGEMLFIPAGFAHGFCTLEDDTHVCYKVDRYYSASHDAGIAWNDPDIGIAWPDFMIEAILSSKDAQLPRLKNS